MIGLRQFGILAPKGPKLQIVANLSCGVSKLAREGNSANEKNIILIGFTSWKKIPKNYQLGQFRNSCEVFCFWGGGGLWRVAGSGLRRQIGRNIHSQVFWRNIHLCGFSNDAFIVYFDIEEVVFNGEWNYFKYRFATANRDWSSVLRLFCSAANKVLLEHHV